MKLKLSLSNLLRLFKTVYTDLLKIASLALKFILPTLFVILWYFFFFEFDQGEDMLITMAQDLSHYCDDIPLTIVNLLSIIALSIAIWFYLRISISKGVAQSEPNENMERSVWEKAFGSIPTRKAYVQIDVENLQKMHKEELVKRIFPRFIASLIFFILGLAFLNEFAELRSPEESTSMILNFLTLRKFALLGIGFYIFFWIYVCKWMEDLANSSMDKLVHFWIGLILAIFSALVIVGFIVHFQRDIPDLNNVLMASFSFILGAFILVFFLTFRTRHLSSFMSLDKLNFYPGALFLMLFGSSLFLINNYALEFWMQSPWIAICSGLGLYLFILTIVRGLVNYFKFRHLYSIGFCLLVFLFLLTPDKSGYHAIPFSINENTELNKSDFRISLKEHFSQWIKERKEDFENVETYPIFFVCAEGGGSRAGFWTSEIISTLQLETQFKFLEHTYAISTVSGSSTGMAGVLSQYKADDSTKPLQNRNVNVSGRALFHEDFLSGSLTQLLGKDLWYQFGGLGKGGRNFRLVKEWNNAFTRLKCGDNRIDCKDVLTVPYLDVWYRDNTFSEFKLPLYFPNTYLVEAAHHAFYSPVKIPLNSLNNSEDLLANYSSVQDSKREISLGEVAVTSASFPIINASSSLQNNGHLVDGGYFDNRGSTLNNILLENIIEIISNPDTSISKFVSKIEIHLVYFINEEVERIAEINPNLLQLTIPLTGLTSTRSAHTKKAQAILEKHIINSGGTTHRIILDHELLIDKYRSIHAKLPLGRILSNYAMTEMERQLVEESTARVSLEKVVEVVQGG